ncbi:MAG TPA: DUF4124 domain-containing protein [Steroidobacteraceae bacterium]|jgi:hypothetical protein|nr:DUF4124 domain-containing protein [Steroidobacteraceae bacterium]
MRRPTALAVIASVFTCAVLSNTVQASDVYKYVDEKGNTLYTDRPIPGAVRVSGGVQRPPEVAARSYAAQQAATNQQLTASNQKIAQDQTNQRLAATVAKDLEASRAERCKKARAEYETAINSRRLYREDKDGKRVYLTDAELSQQRLNAARSVEAICGPQG